MTQEIFWAALAWCVISYPASFFASYYSSKLTWFFTATFWLAVGYILAVSGDITTVIIVGLLFVVTSFLVDGGYRKVKEAEK